ADGEEAKPGAHAGLEDADYYRVSAKKGQRISAEIEGMRLGTIFFDPYLAILDSRRFELATSDDAPLLKQDAFVSVIAPSDGEYTILVRESAYEGNNNCRYRLHIGHFPRPAAIYPPAANPGKETTFNIIGDPAGDYQITATPSGKEGTNFSLFVNRDGLSSPSPNPVLLSNLPYSNEKEPNNYSKEALPPLAAPCAFHGIISKKNDVDWFKFTAKKGQNLSIRVLARSLRSPLDSVLILRDAKGKQLARNDDQGALDSVINFRPPADGDYFINVRDHLRKGGPSYTYRIEIDVRKPALSITLPEARRNDSQLRKPICIPQGNRYAAVVNITRSNTGCDCTLSADSLPQGVTMRHSPAPRGANNMIVFFEAQPEAPIAGGLHHFRVRDAKPGSTVQGDWLEIIHHIVINNTGNFHSTRDDRITVAVTEEAPFHVDLHTPPVPIVRNGTTKLRVTIRRKPGFDAPVTVTLPWKPNGIGSPTQIVIPKGKSETFYDINANNEAAIGTHQIVVCAESNTPAGPVMVSSALVPLTISEPFVSASMAISSTIPGENTAMVCKLEHHKPIQGSARIILHGLPHGVKTKEQTINASTKEIIFPLEVSKDAPKGNHNTIFCQIIPMQNGHPIPHSTGQGGTLKINPPPPKPKALSKAKSNKPAPKPADKTAEKKAPKPKKPLSRLEQLRQQKK
ncbi:MAG: pre-peptidase C-terminal domain-containing protein, partial [Akkermansiaceae bacterium]